MAVPTVLIFAASASPCPPGSAAARGRPRRVVGRSEVSAVHGAAMAASCAEGGGVDIFHRLGGIDHEGASDVGTVLGVARAKGDVDDAVVELLVRAHGGHLELVLAAGLDDGR